MGGKSPFVVFDSADLDSTVEGIVDAIWFNQGQVCIMFYNMPIRPVYSKQRLKKENKGNFLLVINTCSNLRMCFLNNAWVVLIIAFVVLINACAVLTNMFVILINLCIVLINAYFVLMNGRGGTYKCIRQTLFRMFW